VCGYLSMMHEVLDFATTQSWAKCPAERDFTLAPTDGARVQHSVIFRLASKSGEGTDGV
jgi:hypothetical protein